MKNDGLLIMKNSGCVDGVINFSDLDKDGIFKGCEFIEIPEIPLACAKIEKCSVGKNCCILTPFVSSQFNETRMVIERGIDAIAYNHNKNAEYLIRHVETMVQESVRGYDASGCAIKKVIINDFGNLTALETLDLSDNDISRIAANTFWRLKNLKYFNLGNQ